jgi:transposase-like protein
VLSQPDRSLAVECLALSSGMSYLGDSMSEGARRHGVTRAAVSKRCVELTDKLGLPPSRAMRSRAAREAYRQTQLRIRNSHEKKNEGKNRHARRRRNTGS